MPDILLENESLFTQLPSKYAIMFLTNKRFETICRYWKHLNTDARDQYFLTLVKNGKSTTASDIASNLEAFDTISSTTQVLVACSSTDSQFLPVWSKMSHVARRELLEKHISDGFLNKYAKDIMSDKETFSSISPVSQVEFVWGEIFANPLLAWDAMSEQGKVFALYRAIANKEGLDIFSKLPSNGIETQIILSFLQNASEDKRAKAFGIAHEQFLSYVIDRAWSSTNPLRFDPFLAPCCVPERSRVSYCEGRPWFTEEERIVGATRASHAFCPRTRFACELNSVGSTGARIYPDVSLPWQQWSLAEVLKTLSIKPCLPELNPSEEYQTRLAGWINRLNEIRERLKCSVCHTIMKPNLAYSKNLARFNTTVVSCGKGHGHDTNVYLNQCWGCDAIIDSRESLFKVDNYYICIHCGSGPQRFSSYSQGDICPMCGQKEMLKSNSNRRTRQCERCHHTIKVPPTHNRRQP